MFTSKMILGIAAAVCVFSSEADAQCFLRRCVPQRVVRISPANPCRQCTPVCRRIVRSQVSYHAAPRVVSAPTPCTGCGIGYAAVPVAGAAAAAPVDPSADIDELRGRIFRLEQEIGVSYGTTSP